MVVLMMMTMTMVLNADVEKPQPRNCSSKAGLRSTQPGPSLRGRRCMVCGRDNAILLNTYMLLGVEETERSKTELFSGTGGRRAQLCCYCPLLF